jgi:hypothetical protein
MWKVLQEEIGAEFTPTKIDLIFAGALGAAIHAWKFFAATHEVAKAKKQTTKSDTQEEVRLANGE